MSDEPLHVAFGRARDERLAQIGDMIDLEAAQQNGAAFRMAINAVELEAKAALDMLVEVNPSDFGAIAYCQAQVHSARSLRDFLQSIINRGKDAEVSFREDPYVRPSYE